MIEDLRSYVESNPPTDLESSVSGERFPEHSRVITASCPDLAPLLLDESFKNILGSLIVYTNPKAFRTLLEFMYTGRLNHRQDRGTIVCTLHLAHKFSLKKLKRECALYLIDCLEIENAIGFLYLADRCEEELLVKRTVIFITENYSSFSGRPDWKYLVESHPQLVSRANQFLV